MKTTIITLTAAALLLLAALTLAGCAEDTPSSITASDSSAVSAASQAKKIAALEAEIAAIRQNALAREEAMKQELATLRANFDHIQGLLQAEKERTQALPPAAPVTPETKDGMTAQEMEDKAKKFFDENMDKLMDGSKKLLDQMEEAIEEQMRKLTPAPKGEEV